MVSFPLKVIAGILIGGAAGYLCYRFVGREAVP